MFEQIPVGDRLYLFTDRNKRANSLVITSHGVYVPRPEFGRQTGVPREIPGLGGWFAVPPGVTLYFYGPHRTSLKDPGVSGVVMQHVVPYERLSEGATVRNYRLFKYDDEYSTLMAGIRYRDRTFGDQKMDVLTVRNRWWGKLGITLKDVLSMLAEAQFHYEHIHCVFCRAPLIGPYKSVAAPLA